MQWIDVTDMIAWRGNFTGVQRVTYEYAKRFVEDGAQLFAYDALDHRFIEVPIREIDDAAKQERTESPLHMTRKRKLRLLFGAPYYRLSKDTRAHLSPYIIALNHLIRTTLHQIERSIPRSQPRFVSPYRDFGQAAFRDGDTVVLLGAGWNDDTVLTELIKLKNTVKVQLVQHINDILPIYQPQLFADNLPDIFEPYITKALLNADVITVISKATQRDIEVYCQEKSISVPRIEVIRLGDNLQLDIQSRMPKDLNQSRFILAVGTFEVRKNYILLYQAIKLAQVEGRELPTFVIAGRKGWLTEDVRHMIGMDPYAKNRIVWLPDVSDVELKWLYENCLFTVFPSIAEGWGLPIVESLQNGKFCLSSGTSSMLEIGDGLVDYFLPYDARECLAKIEYYLYEQRYEEMNRRVATEYKLFTWDDSYRMLKIAIN